MLLLSLLMAVGAPAYPGLAQQRSASDETTSGNTALYLYATQAELEKTLAQMTMDDRALIPSHPDYQPVDNPQLKPLGATVRHISDTGGSITIWHLYRTVPLKDGSYPLCRVEARETASPKGLSLLMKLIQLCGGKLELP